MSRSGYTDDDCDGYNALWRGQVASAIRGKRGQAFLHELIEALDALPEKKLIAEELHKEGAVCAIGSVWLKRGIDMAPLDVEDFERLGKVFGIAHQLVCEIEYVNDELGSYKQTPEDRWQRVRDWAVKNLKEHKP
mgnify:CR=1 FL=1